MLAELLFQFIEFAVRTAVLLGLLWVMIKLQRFNRKYEYRFRKLVFIAALAGAMDMIPYAGHFLAFPVLWVGAKKVTHADYVETFLTVAVSFALVFSGTRLFLQPFMSDLRTRVEKINVWEMITPPRLRKKAESGTAINTNLPSAETNLSVLQTNAAGTNLPAAATNLSAGSVTTNPVTPSKPAPRLVKYISVKGVTRNAANSAATIQSGTKVYTVFLEEAALMQTPEGPVSVRFAELGTNSVILEINGEPARFMVR